MQKNELIIRCNHAIIPFSTVDQIEKLEFLIKQGDSGFYDKCCMCELLQKFFIIRFRFFGLS